MYLRTRSDATVKIHAFKTNLSKDGSQGKSSLFKTAVLGRFPGPSFDVKTGVLRLRPFLARVRFDKSGACFRGEEKWQL